MIFRSKTITNYYSNTPDEYILKFHHYNILVDNNSKEEYLLLESDIQILRNINKQHSIIYFSDLDNFEKVLVNTNILDNAEDVYLRIRNEREYKKYKGLKKKVNIVIEYKDIERIHPINEKVTVQIDNVSEIDENRLNDLRIRYQVEKILVGQICYITNECKYLLKELSNQFNLEISNQLELEKNNEITNDIYDLDTYKKILHEFDKIINQNFSDNIVEMIKNIFDYIAENVYYDTKGGTAHTNIESQNLIGPVFNGKSVCEGYSKMFKQILSLIKVESHIVSGGDSKENGGMFGTKLE